MLVHRSRVPTSHTPEGLRGRHASRTQGGPESCNGADEYRRSEATAPGEGGDDDQPRAWWMRRRRWRYAEPDADDAAERRE